MAHLLCNPVNHPIVHDFSHDVNIPDIPKEFENAGYTLAHYYYMCGSAPRFVGESGKHLSQDALKELTENSVGLNFYFWAQQERFQKYASQIGLPKSMWKREVPVVSEEVASRIMAFKDRMENRHRQEP